MLSHSSSSSSSSLSYPVPGPHSASGPTSGLCLAEAQPRPAAPGGEEEALQLDRLAVSLRVALDRITVPLAFAATAFVRWEGWTTFGYARLSDHARERFGRSSRWVRDLAALGGAIPGLPGLAEALTGEDGGAPLGRVSGMLVATVASPSTLQEWVGRARAGSVRELRAAVRAARQGDGDSDATETSDPSGEVLVRLAMPAPVREAFDEALDLFRAGEGGEAPVAEFVEAMLAECVSSVTPEPELAGADVLPLRQGVPRTEAELGLARATNRWAELRGRTKDISPAAFAIASLRRLDEVARWAGRGGPIELDSQIRDLIALEDQLELRLGQILAEMADCRAWRRLRFDGAAHYAEERLGLSSTGARRRVRAARGLRKLQSVRQAYEQGTVWLEATLHLVRILEDRPADAAVQAAWVGRARVATIKRLRDEARALSRARVESAGVEGANNGAPAPLDDAAWHASLRRRTGMARERVARFAALAAREPVANVFLGLRLQADLARDFIAMIGLVRDRVKPGAPAWVGLLAMLEEFVEVWDAAPRHAGDAIYERDGFRCAAPGCTSRRNLEDHHVIYRSRGGGNAARNRLSLCRFHHQRGEHGGLASCRGEAPLKVVWRLGQRVVARWYRNERRVG